ncbi:MAG: hypothetical protein ACPG31_11300 [Planctomycetota bacterium]
MFLLPGAERYRRVLLTVGAVAVVAVQAVLRFPAIDHLAYRVIGPVQKPLTELAGTVSEWVVGGAKAAEGPEPPATSALIAIERERGMPAPIPGMAWLEVPVQLLELERGRLVLAAGEDFHLAEDQIVAFGDAFLGRIGAVRAFEADVELWTSADMRTGLSVVVEEGPTLPAVCFGRGSGGPAVVAWSEDETRFAPGLPLAWRPRPLDPPNLAQARLHLGQLQSIGDQKRGDATWVVEQSIPVAAEGRVFVAAGAVGATLVAEPSQRKAAASPMLLPDAVLGDDWYAFSSDAGFRPTVVVDRGRVNGQVGDWRGSWGWARRLPPAAWSTDAVALQLQTGEVLAADAWRDAAEALPLFTRGGAGIPRGLWLGYRDDVQHWPSASLEALRLDSSPTEVR